MKIPVLLNDQIVQIPAQKVGLEARTRPAETVLKWNAAAIQSTVDFNSFFSYPLLCPNCAGSRNVERTCVAIAAFGKFVFGACMFLWVTSPVASRRRADRHRSNGNIATMAIGF
jgi:hypothetical protein